MKTALTKMFRRWLPKRKPTTPKEPMLPVEHRTWRPAEAPHHGLFLK